MCPNLFEYKWYPRAIYYSVINAVALRCLSEINFFDFLFQAYKFMIASSYLLHFSLEASRFFPLDKGSIVSSVSLTPSHLLKFRLWTLLFFSLSFSFDSISKPIILKDKKRQKNCCFHNFTNCSFHNFTGFTKSAVSL